MTTAASHVQFHSLVAVECCFIRSESVVHCLGCEVVNPPVLGYNGAFLFSFLICSVIVWKHKCDLKSGFWKHSHQENEGLVSQEILCMADAAQCLVELAGSVRTDLDLFLERALLSLGSCRRHWENNLLNLSTLQRMK